MRKSLLAETARSVTLRSTEHSLSARFASLVQYFLKPQLDGLSRLWGKNILSFLMVWSIIREGDIFHIAVVSSATDP